MADGPRSRTADLLIWARDLVEAAQKVQADNPEDNKVTIAVDAFAKLVALAARTPQRGGPNFRTGRQNINEAMLWRRARRRYRDLRKEGHDPNEAAKTAHDEFKAKWPHVFDRGRKPGDGMSLETFKDRVTRTKNR